MRAGSRVSDSDPSPRRPPFVIGLTGTIASGKSTVAEMLRRRGAQVIDADAVYQSLLGPGSELARRIGERFGPAIVRPNGEIDRRALGEIVFTDGDALADLDRITHPPVVAAIREKIARSTAPVVVVEAIKLVQSGLRDDIDQLWLVTADAEVRQRRLMARGLDEGAARARMAAHPDPAPQWTRVDVSIENSGDLAATERTIERAWRSVDEDINERAAQRVGRRIGEVQ